MKWHSCKKELKKCVESSDQYLNFVDRNANVIMNWRKIIFHTKTIWIGLGCLSILLSSVLPMDFVERFYSRGLFLFIRKLFSLITDWLPFALVYPLFFILLFLLINWLINLISSKNNIKTKSIKALTGLFALIGGAIFFFQFLWGFNYGRIPLEKQLMLEVAPLDVNKLKNELDWAIVNMTNYRDELSGVGEQSIPISFLPNHIEDTMRHLLGNVLQEFNYPIPSKVRGRLLFPKGFLLRISTAGVYIPFSGEGHIDPGLHHLQLPFVMAHEMSHAYGIGGEGDCNFLAYLSCISSNNPYLKYVGYLYYWRYIAPDYRAYRPEEYKEIWANLPEGIKNDLRAIRKEMDKYPDILPAVRDAAYNTYLKAQGIDDGIKNYDRVTMLAHAWHKKKGQVIEN